MSELVDILTLFIGLDDFVDILIAEDILVLPRFKFFGGIDKENVVSIRAAITLKNEDADGNSCAEEEIGGKPNNGIQHIHLFY